MLSIARFTAMVLSYSASPDNRYTEGWTDYVLASILEFLNEDVVNRLIRYKAEPSALSGFKTIYTPVSVYHYRPEAALPCKLGGLLSDSHNNHSIMSVHLTINLQYCMAFLLTLGAHARGLRYLSCVSVRSSVCPFVRSSVCPFVRSSVCPFVRLSVRPFVRSSVCPFVRSSVCPFVRSSVRPFVRSSVRHEPGEL